MTRRRGLKKEAGEELVGVSEISEIEGKIEMFWFRIRCKEWAIGGVGRWEWKLGIELNRMERKRKE